MSEEHPKWCIAAAEIITGEKYKDPEGERLSTEYGEKTCEGIADIIYRQFMSGGQEAVQSEVKIAVGLGTCVDCGLPAQTYARDPDGKDQLDEDGDRIPVCYGCAYGRAG